MKSFIRFFAERHLLAYLLVFTIILLGLSSALTVKRDMFPDVDLDKLMITTRYPGASPEDVELNVTNKLEEEINNVDGIDIMESYSMENISVINVTVDIDADDKEKVKRDIREAVNRVTDLPVEVTETPYIFEVKTENIEIIWIGVGGDIPYKELREYARQFEKRLEAISGVSRIDKTGYLDREIKVEVSENAVENFQLPLREIATAIQGRNIRATGGSFESYTSDKNIVTMAQFRDPEEVANVIVRSTFDGPRVKVGDLALIKDGFEPEKTRFRMNGKEVIALTVFKKKSADMIRVVDAVKELIEEERKTLPEGIELFESADMSRYVRNRLGILKNNGLIGLILVSLVLSLFLNLRTAFWVAMGIPLAVMGVLFLAPHFDVHVDAIGMMGMVIVIGLIVDDAIVIAENIHRHREMGKSPLEAAVDGTYEVLSPVSATIVTTILAFAPMFFMTGMMGKFIFPIPLVIMLALLVSYSEAITTLPAHIAAGMKSRAKRFERKGITGSRQVHSHAWFQAIKSRFQRFIVHVLVLRYPVIIVFILMFCGAIWYANKYMHFILFPSNTAEQLYITVELPTGSSLDATSDKVKEIEELITSLPEGELESFMSFIGSLGGGSGWFTPGESENWAFVSITLTPFSERSRTADEIVESLRQYTDEMKGFDAVRYIIDAGGPPVGRPIVIRVVGSGDEIRTALADSVVAYLNSMEGVTDIDRDDKLGKEQVEIKFNYPSLSQVGLTVADVASNVRLAYDGQVVTRVRYGDEDVGFRVQLEENARKRPDYLSELKVPNRQGRLIPLKGVATFEIGPGPSSYFHYDKERAITITSDIAQGGLTPLEATLATVDHFDLKDWPGMRFVIGGEAEETQESFVSLGITMLIAVLGMYFILILLFNSFSQPLLVLIAIPFGLTGVIGAFAIHGEPLGFLAMMGVIGLMGVVVNDSLILVNYINFHREEQPDKKYLRIVAEGTADRLRPILLTSFTTVAGVLPMAYGAGGVDPFIAPMAMALGYGIVFATPLTLLLLPCLYMVRHDIGRIFIREKKAESVES
jgi:multidrug efflux pump subunit AcrB